MAISNDVINENDSENSIFRKFHAHSCIIIVERVDCINECRI